MRLTMYLLRRGADVSDSSLRSSSAPEPLKVKESIDEEIAAFLITGATRVPKWISELQTVVHLDQDPLEFATNSTGAVVLVRTEGRVVALTFGIGFHAIEPALIERGFGLRVAANLVATDKVRGAQTRGVARHSRDQKTILATDGSFSELAVEVDEDWLRQLSGKSSDVAIASSLSGADSLRISAPNFRLRDLSTKVAEILTLYEAQDYKEKFPFLDQVVPLDRSDPAIAALDGLAREQLRAEEPRTAFAPPDPFEQVHLDHYELTANYHRYALDDLDNESVFSVLRTLPPNKDPLIDVQVFAIDGDGATIERHNLRSYAQTECELDGTQYLLSAGQWFEVNTDFAAGVERQLQQIDDITDELALPPWDAAALKIDHGDPTTEGSYNKLVSSARGFALLDKDLVHFGPHEKLEIADLLTPGSHLLCVKAASSSSTLSHLIAQAIDSSRAWAILPTSRWSLLLGSSSGSKSLSIEGARRSSSQSPLLKMARLAQHCSSSRRYLSRPVGPRSSVLASSLRWRRSR